MAAPEPVQTINVVLTSPNGIKADAELRITEWTDNKRAAIAYKRLGMWWVAALFLIIIPPHILWFSIAFIGGIVAAILAMRQQAGLFTPKKWSAPTVIPPQKSMSSLQFGHSERVVENVGWCSGSSPARANE